MLSAGRSCRGPQLIRLLDSVPLADPYALLQVLFTGTAVATDALIGGTVVLLVFAVAGGRTFCAWVCPMNMVTDLAERLRDAEALTAGSLR